VSAAPRVVKASAVRIGDRIRARETIELTVTRIDEAFMGREEMLAFVEDSNAQWLKLPAGRDAEIELLSTIDTQERLRRAARYVQPSRPHVRTHWQ
jgi:hypothetical protein